MPHALDFTMLDDNASEPKKWARRDANAVVQMSLRMPTETYERFRYLCKTERRTNGDMLRVLMEGHLERSQGERPDARRKE